MATIDIDEFERNSHKRKQLRHEMRLYRQNKYNRNIKYLKRSVAGVVALVTMGIGIVKFFPAMFDKFSATTDKQSSHSEEQDRSKKPKTNDKENKISMHKSIKGSKNETKTSKVEKSQIKKEELKPDVFSIGGNGDTEVSEFLNTYMGQVLISYANDYGVDPNIIASICMAETCLQHDRCCPGGDWYSGYGVGYGQLESPDGSLVVEAYNYTTGNYDSIAVTMENACDPALNLKITCMLFQDSINYFDGNIGLAIYAHNFGKYMIDAIISRNYHDPEALKKDYSDVSWLEFVKEAHYNPGLYIDDWDVYGSDDYLPSVLSNCPVDTIQYIYENELITLKLSNMQVLSRENINKSSKTY